MCVCVISIVCMLSLRNSTARTPTPLNEGSSSVSSPQSNSSKHDLPVPVQQTQREEVTFREGYRHLLTVPRDPRNKYLPTGGTLPDKLLSSYITGYNVSSDLTSTTCGHTSTTFCLTSTTCHLISTTGNLSSTTCDLTSTTGNLTTIAYAINV